MPVSRRSSVYLLIIFFSSAFFSSAPTLAYVMSSTNYRVQFDSLNTGGGMGTSTDYKIEDTVGEVSSGSSTSTSYNLYAGYQQMDQNSVLSLTVPDSLSLSPAIGGLTGGVSDGQADILVSTNAGSGYTLYVRASANPALVSGLNSFENITTAVGESNFNWQVSATSNGFGFTPQGGDIVSKYKDNGSNCNEPSGSDTAYRCWDYFSTTDTQISQSSNYNYPSYTTTSLFIRAESGAQNSQMSGNYTATVTITAHVN